MALVPMKIMRRTGKSKPTIWRWQERYIEEGVDGLLRDKTRPSRIAPLNADKRLEVIKFLKKIDRTVKKGITLHLILDN